jgi:hypothetical protein
MTRLRHRLKAYLMALRMTGNDTILYVEGRDNDPAFYEAVAKRYQVETGRQWNLRLAAELPNAALPAAGGAGGKQALLRAAIFLDRWCANRAVGLSGREVAFCVDKDIDEIEGKLINCRGLIYTRMHSVENHLFLASDLVGALAPALSATEQSVARELNTYGNIQLLAQNWRDWVVCCSVAVALGIKNVGTYSRSSPVNVPPHGPADQTLVQNFHLLLRRKCGLSADAFDLRLQQISQEVDGLLQRGRFDEVFKGKWYGDILFSLLGSCPVLGAGCRAAGKGGLWIGIRTSFAVPEDDYRYYAAGIRNGARP